MCLCCNVDTHAKFPAQFLTVMCTQLCTNVYNLNPSCIELHLGLGFDNNFKAIIGKKAIIDNKLIILQTFAQGNCACQGKYKCIYTSLYIL